MSDGQMPNMWHRQTNLTLKVNVSDNSGGSGVSKYTYTLRKRGGTETTGENNDGAGIPIEEGITEVRLSAQDNAGNSKTLAETIKIKKDITPPTFNMGATPIVDTTKTTATSIVLNAIATDNASGDTTTFGSDAGQIKYTYYVAEANASGYGEAKKTGTETQALITDLKPGTNYKILIVAQDPAGNSTQDNGSSLGATATTTSLEKPQITLEPASPDGKNNWYICKMQDEDGMLVTRNIKVTITATKADTDSIYYTKTRVEDPVNNGESVTVGPTLYTGTFDLNEPRKNCVTSMGRNSR